MRDLISFIQARFPPHHDRVARHMAGDPEFLSICEDYRACHKAHHYWTHSNSPEAEERAKEYQTLIEELEGEIAVNLRLAVTP